LHKFIRIWRNRWNLRSNPILELSVNLSSWWHKTGVFIWRRAQRGDDWHRPSMPRRKDRRSTERAYQELKVYQWPPSIVQIVLKKPGLDIAKYW